MPRPLQTLIDNRAGYALALSGRLAALYGRLKMPRAGQAPYVLSNFVATLDGIVSLQQPGHLGGSDISGHDVHDRMVMGLLRAVSDVVLIGAGTLRADPRHIWSAPGICPELAEDYRQLRLTLDKPDRLLLAIVTGSGDVDLRLPVFASPQVRVLVLTTAKGARRMAKQTGSSRSAVIVLPSRNSALSPPAILQAIGRQHAGSRVLLEGGPHLLGAFYRAHLVDDQFLTLSPQVLGRTAGDHRLGLLMGQSFAAGRGRWGELTDLRRSRSHLFLRYGFAPSRSRQRRRHQPG